MICIATKEKADKLSSDALYVLLFSDCKKCAAIARDILVERKTKQLEEFLIKQEEKEASKSEERHVSKKPKVRTSHDLSFLIKDSSGSLAPAVYKDLDSRTLHEIIDYAGEVTISRVDVK